MSPDDIPTVPLAVPERSPWPLRLVVAVMTAFAMVNAAPWAWGMGRELAEASGR